MPPFPRFSLHGAVTRSAVVSRRLFLAGGIGVSAVALPPLENEAVYDFATAGCEVRMTVAFYDHYSSSGFWFQDLLAGRRFCLSAIGEQDRNCPSNFVGSLAVAHYRFQPHSELGSMTTLREHVRAIDRDARLKDRPPLERIIELRQGAASDIQAFGYETAPPVSSASARLPETGGPWYYSRQELYFAGRATPFLIIHWRHAFGAIRILDVIPGDGTSPVTGTR